MPNTVWCGRKYGFSTDICVFQGIWDGLAGTTMLICGVCMLLINGGNKLPALQQCWDLGPTYVISFLILFGVWLIISCMLVYAASKGLPAETNKRLNVLTIFNIRIFLLILIIADNIIGFFWLFDINSSGTTTERETSCASINMNVILYVVTVVHTCFSLHFLFLMSSVCCCRRKSKGNGDQLRNRKRSIYKSFSNNEENDLQEVFLVVPGEDDVDFLADKYENSCRRSCWCIRRIFCCFAGDAGDDEVFETVGRLMAQFFQELDVTTDDMLLGIRLVQIEQRTKERKKLLSSFYAAKNSHNSNNEIQHVNGAAATDSVNIDVKPVSVVGNGKDDNMTKRESAEIKLLEKESSKTFYDQTSSSNEKPFGATDADIETFREIQYYYKYALGIYGHWLYIYKSYAFLPGAVDIVCCSNACCCCAKGNSTFEAPDSCYEKVCDNCIDTNTCYGANYAGMMKTIKGVKHEDVVYISFAQSYLCSPFALVVDHSKKSIVLTVRGTMSLDDCVKDVIAIAHPLSDEAQKEWGFSNDVTNLYCHKGMYDTAMDILNRLDAKGLLPYNGSSNNLNGDGGDASNSKGKKDDGQNKRNRGNPSSFLLNMYKDYEMIVTGHSLGAGIASILTLLLHKKMPKVRGLVYSPPPCFSAPLAKYTKSIITGVSVGGDLIGRLSPQNMSRMKRRMVSLLQATNTEKYKVLCSLLCSKSAALSEFVDLSKVKNDDDWANLSDEEVSRPLKPYYLPGNLIHLALKSRNRPCCCSCLPACLYETCCDPEREYEPRWILDNTKAMQEILIHSRMTADHFPDTIEKTLSGKYIKL